MGLLDRFTTRTKPVNFADGTSRTKREVGGPEIGVAGESVYTGFDGEETRTDKYSVDDYIRMRQNDGTLSSLYNILTMPVLAAQFSLKPDENDAAGEQLAFIKQNLLEPPHRGGMEIPLSLVLADMLRGVLEGFRAFEKVYGLRDGRIYLKKLASRDSRTVKLIRANDGGYGGLKQKTTFKGRDIDVFIPASKSFLYTYGKDKNYLYGESAFKAAAYHYDKKHKLYYLANLSVQSSGVPAKIITGPEGFNEKEKSAAMKMAELLGGVRSVAYIPDKLKLEAFNGTAGRVDPLPLIEHHDVQMARSVLAQMLLLGGTQGSSGGSFALSRDHTDILMMALKGVMRTIEDHINYYLIPDLIDFNFATPAYPKFRFEDMTSDTRDLITEAFKNLSSSGGLDPALQAGVEARIAEALDINVDAEQKLLDKKNAKKVADAKAAGVEVDAQGNPLPVAPVAPVDPTKPTPKAPAVINQSEEAHGDHPKAPTSVTGGGTGRLPQRRSAFSLLR